MAITNHERVGKALEYLNAGLLPFVEREMLQVYGDDWENIAVKAYPEDHPGRGEKGRWDTQKILVVMWDQWNNVFIKTLGHAERSIVSELRETRNNWAHQQTFSGNDTYRALDSVERLLNAVSAPQAADVEKMRIELLRTQFEDKRRVEMRKVAYQPTEGKPQGDLPPWRTVVTPHPDVASGRYQQAEFAADLWQVYLKEGSDEYKDPVEFYQRTFLTEGLKTLLKKSLLRLSANEGDPVVELQTNFGGGKTHSMLALYHLFSGAKPGSLPGIEELMNEAAVTVPKKVNRVVIVGTKISPGQPSKKPDGTVVRTLWGEIAWQLGGKKAFKMVKEDDERGTNPGDTLKELFNAYSPCLILIDEWVAYARQLRDDSSLPGGTFDTQFTFAQALSEAAKAAKHTMLVVSVPSSDNEIGGEWGKKALERLKNAIGRVESPWKPATQDEGFEIVRRRLFQPLTDSQAVQRDAVAHSCSELYKTQSQEFPSECREASYERRIKMAYPIHPEMFDRLYNDWSTLDKFQRTRGVLRLMAAVIHSLWERQDANLLIMPATIPIDDPSVQFELTRYLEDQWVPVIEKDVDGPHSLPLEIDRENSNLGRYSACRRVSRTIYLGSAPTTKVANRGIDDKRVKLGCVQPGESVATFGDALRRLTDRATYLYVDGTRYWYSTQPSVTRLAEDRAGQLSADDISEEIQRRLRTQTRTRGDFVKVHTCTSSSDIPDEREARLIILAPEYPHTAKDPNSPARAQAEEILASRGSSPRTYRNTLVFLAPDNTRLQELNNAVKSFLAWKSIREEREALNLDPFQTKQAETKCKTADETVEVRIPETYQWVLAPQQTDPKKEIEWVEMRQQGQDPLAPRASKKLRNDEMLLVTLGGERLRHEIDKIPLWRGNHVPVKQLVEDFATYLYLPRLKDEEVLYSAIRTGVNFLTWQTETFAYSAGWDEEKKRYLNLNPSTQSYNFDSGKSLLVKPEIAAAQIEKDRTKYEGLSGDTAQEVTPLRPGAVWEGGGTLTGKTATGHTDAGPVYRRFHGSVKIDPIRIGRDTNKIADEIVQHFNALTDADVEVTLEISVKLQNGANEKIVRDVTENCRTLKFDNFGFEEE
jgi:predicted AAA+ superfamily ATPase